MININEIDNEQTKTIIIDDKGNGLRVQFDFFEQLVGIYFNMNIHDYFCGEGFQEGDSLIIEIHRYEEPLLYDILKPFFKERDFYSFKSVHSFPALKEDENPNTFIIAKTDLGISICLDKNPREFSDNVHLDEKTENVDKLRELYYYLSMCAQSNKCRKILEYKRKKAGVISEN